MVGRVLHPHPEKTRALIHDHAGCMLTLGLPDNQRKYSLDAESNDYRESVSGMSAIQCRKCFRRKGFRFAVPLRNKTGAVMDFQIRSIRPLPADKDGNPNSLRNRFAKANLETFIGCNARIRALEYDAALAKPDALHDRPQTDMLLQALAHHVDLSLCVDLDSRTLVQN